MSNDAYSRAGRQTSGAAVGFILFAAIMMIMSGVFQALQGLVACIIALSGTYDQILSYVVSTDFVFFGLTGLALFLFRAGGEGGEGC